MSKRQGYATVTPYLICRGANAAIDYYKKNLGATEIYRLAMPNGLLVHAEIKIGDSVIMLTDEMADMGLASPKTLGATSVTLNVYVEDADKIFTEMINDGATAIFKVQDQFHGDRSGKLKDPFGHVWHIATNKQNYKPDEIVAQFKSIMQG
jgi:PhnB protein